MRLVVLTSCYCRLCSFRRNLPQQRSLCSSYTQTMCGGCLVVCLLIPLGSLFLFAHSRAPPAAQSSPVENTWLFGAFASIPSDFPSRQVSSQAVLCSRHTQSHTLHMVCSSLFRRSTFNILLRCERKRRKSCLPFGMNKFALARCPGFICVLLVDPRCD